VGAAAGAVGAAAWPSADLHASFSPLCM
jgi:hypothetical protein